MIHQPTDGEPLPEPLAALQTHYPGWSIWTSNGSLGLASHCYATRLQRQLTHAQVRVGLAMTVYADTADGLAAKLAQQTEVRS